MPHDFSTRSDQELARVAAGGDRAAFEAIVRRYSRPLTDFAANKTASIQDAEDIVQETFLRAFLNLNTFNAQYSLKNWLFVIAYRLVVSSYRKKKPQQIDQRVVSRLVDEQSTSTPEADWIWQLAEQLGDSAHTVLWLRYKQQMDVSDIAQIMNKSAISVRVQLHRARRRLAERIETLAANDAAGNRTHRRGVLFERTNRI